MASPFATPFFINLDFIKAVMKISMYHDGTERLSLLEAQLYLEVDLKISKFSKMKK